MKTGSKATGHKKAAKRSPVGTQAGSHEDWSILQTLPASRLSELLGPTIGEVMEEDFDAETIAKIERNADERALQWRRIMRAESVASGVLRKIRMYAGITQKEMARRLVVSPPAKKLPAARASR